MPLTETCMLKLQQFIEYYELLSFEQWEKSVEDILEEVTAYHEACTALVKIHENILAVLKKRQDKAKARISQNIYFFNFPVCSQMSSQ